MINSIASNFCNLKENEIEELSKFPLDFLYSIVQSENLKLIDEDSLIDFIEKIFSTKREKDENAKNIGIENFYEEVKLENLSFSKFSETFEKIDLNDMTENFYLQLKQLLVSNFKENLQNRIFSSRYLKQKSIGQQFKYEGKKSGAFKGIIAHLTEKCGGNVSDMNEIEVTSSVNPAFINRLPKCAVDFEIQNYFQSDDQIDS